MLQIQGSSAPVQVEAGTTSFSFSSGAQTGYISLAAQYDQAHCFLVLDTHSQPSSAGGSMTVIKAWLDAANPRIVVSYYGSSSGAVNLRWRVMQAPAGQMVQQGVATAAFPATGLDQCLSVSLAQSLPRPDKALIIVNFTGGAFLSDNGAASAYGLYAVLADAGTLRLYSNYNTAGAGVNFTLPWCVLYGR